MRHLLNGLAIIAAATLTGLAIGLTGWATGDWNWAGMVSWTVAGFATSTTIVALSGVFYAAVTVGDWVSAKLDR